MSLIIVGKTWLVTNALLRSSLPTIFQRRVQVMKDHPEDHGELLIDLPCILFRQVPKVYFTRTAVEIIFETCQLRIYSGTVAVDL